MVLDSPFPAGISSYNLDSRNKFISQVSQSINNGSNVITSSAVPYKGDADAVGSLTSGKSNDSSVEAVDGTADIELPTEVNDSTDVNINDTIIDVVSEDNNETISETGDTDQDSDVGEVDDSIGDIGSLPGVPDGSEDGGVGSVVKPAILTFTYAGKYVDDNDEDVVEAETDEEEQSVIDDVPAAVDQGNDVDKVTDDLAVEYVDDNDEVVEAEIDDEEEQSAIDDVPVGVQDTPAIEEDGDNDEQDETDQYVAEESETEDETQDLGSEETTAELSNDNEVEDEL